MLWQGREAGVWSKGFYDVMSSGKMTGSIATLFWRLAVHMAIVKAILKFCITEAHLSQ